MIIFTHDPVAEDGKFTCSFRVRHGYPPSSANNWQLAVLSEISPDTGGNGSWISEGLILGVNLDRADDHLVLWQWVQGTGYELCTTSLDFQESVGPDGSPLLSLEVEEDGNVSIYFAISGSESSLIGEGQLMEWPGGRQLAVCYQYSAAQDRKFWIDDLTLAGSFRKDTLPPRIDSVKVIDSEHVRLEFTEPVGPPDCSSFLLQWPDGERQSPVSCNPAGEAEVILRFEKDLPNREWMELHVAGICDRDGNYMGDTLLYVRRNEAAWGDVVFNEVMADPDPEVGLLPREYLELYNRSGEDIDLAGWQLAVNEHVYQLATRRVEPGYNLPPAGYAIVTEIPLPNDGGLLILQDERGTLVHAVTYCRPWMGPEWKKEGGWSVESPDPERICGVSALWGYSTNPAGGTPGRINSLDAEIKDTDPPVLLYTGFGDNEGVFSLYFSEPVRYSHWGSSHFPLSPGEQIPDSVSPALPLSDRVDIWLPEGMEKTSEFTLGLPFLVDCSGNLCRSREVRGGNPLTPQYGKIVINEVMYAPRDGAPEYIELYNPGQGYYDLKDFRLDVVREGNAQEGTAQEGTAPEGTTLEKPVALTTRSRLMAPGSYVVLTGNTGWFMDAYHLELDGKWMEIDTWRTLNNSGGIIYLTDRAGQTVDLATFGDHMHMELLGNTAGISLERIDAERPGDDPGNWHSAASIAGYATPGEPNSQRSGVADSDHTLQVSPKVFSPDNDGYEDLLEITVSPGGHGWSISLRVTDLEGRKIKTLANNHLSGPVAVYRWDGEQDDGRMAIEGIYLLHAWGYHGATGKKWTRRVSVGVIYR